MVITIPYPNEYSCRLEEPIRDAMTARRNGARVHDGKAYDVIFQQGKDRKMHDQAFRYPKKTWTAEEAQAHCAKHTGRFEMEKDKDVGFLKADDEKQIVYGIVFEPEFVFDADQNFEEPQAISRECIEEAAHDYLINIRKGRNQSHQKLSHRVPVDQHTDIVESYIAPVDFEINGVMVKEGTWIVGMKIYDKDLWNQTKESITGFSAGGTAEIL